MAFPVVSLIDSFKRAGEKPLSEGARWVAIFGMAATGEVTGESYGSSAAFPTENGAYWTPASFAGNQGIDWEYRSGLTSERFGRLWCCLSSPTTAAINGYALKIRGEAGGKVKLILEKITAGAFSTLGEKAAVTLAEGDRYGISVKEGKVIAWHKVGAGEWVNVFEQADASYTEGFVGVSAAGNASRWRNAEAGGAPISAFMSVTQKSSPTLSRSISRTLTVGQPSSARVVPSPVFKITQGQSATVTGGRITHEVLTTTQGHAVTLEAVIVTKAEKEKTEEERREERPHVKALSGHVGMVLS